MRIPKKRTTSKCPRILSSGPTINAQESLNRNDQRRVGVIIMLSFSDEIPLLTSTTTVDARFHSDLNLVETEISGGFIIDL